MQIDEEGFWYPVVDQERCIDCGLCEKSCPVLNKSIVDNYPTAYAAVNKDKHIRNQSSSGGLFTIVAESIIRNNGIVFGAGFDDDFNVVHSWTDNIAGLNQFRGSKYIQSCIGTTYKEARDFLKQGKKVLFSGTPCQIAGLKSYLGKDYDNLMCIDIICHGVPSPNVWRRYKEALEERSQGKTLRIAFRSKVCGWKLFSLSFSFDNDKEYSKRLTEDIYLKGFLQNLYLRPSCYNCHFKTINRQSDITLADFWGVHNILPEFDDDKGTSLVLVNSDKGKEIFSLIVDQIKYEKVDIGEAISYNSAAVKSAVENPKREYFFMDLARSADIIQLLTEYTKVTFTTKIYRKLRFQLSRIKRTLLRCNLIKQ